MDNIIQDFWKNEIDREEVIQMLMTEYGSQVKRLAYAYVKNIQTAEDISQEVFVKCYKKLDQYKGDAAIKTWINRITVNLCKDHLRSAWLKHVNLHTIFDFFKSDEATPESRMTEREELDELTKKVLSLPLKYREIIILYYFEELSTQEISELLHMKAATVMTRMRRGRHLIKEFYEKEDQ